VTGFPAQQHKTRQGASLFELLAFFAIAMVRGVEPPTSSSAGKRSIH
jgi:hypothetical protein